MDGAHERVLVWDDGRLVERSAASFPPSVSPSDPRGGPHAASTLRAADSFLVVDGSVTALPRHRSRFVESLAGHNAFSPADLDRFWRAAVASLPRSGRWFPRFDAWEEGGDGTLLVRLRPAPARRSTVVLATSAGADPRTAPSVKGPDIGLLPLLRERAGRSGAEELVFLDGGRISGGASTSILWWRNGRLCVVPEGIAHVAGTTQAALVELARHEGLRVEAEPASPSDLAGCEVWAVNALHGVRLVREWVAGPRMDTSEHAVHRAAGWQARWEALRGTIA